MGYFKDYFVNRKKRRDTEKSRTQELNAIACTRVKHEAGLNLAVGAECILYLSEKALTIDCEGFTFTLPVERLLSMSYDSNRPSQVHSNITKKETVIASKVFMNFTYEKDGTPECLSFNYLGAGMSEIKFAEAFRKLKAKQGTEQRTVEL